MTGPFALAATHEANIVAATWLELYEPMEIAEHGYGFSAVRRGYDGAPDSRCPMGIGGTKAEAVVELVEQEWERAS